MMFPLQVRAFGSVSEWMGPVGMERITSSLLVRSLLTAMRPKSPLWTCWRSSSWPRIAVAD